MSNIFYGKVVYLHTLKVNVAWQYVWGKYMRLGMQHCLSTLANIGKPQFLFDQGVVGVYNFATGNLIMWLSIILMCNKKILAINYAKKRAPLKFTTDIVS